MASEGLDPGRVEDVAVVAEFMAAGPGEILQLVPPEEGGNQRPASLDEPEDAEDEKDVEQSGAVHKASSLKFKV